MKEQNEPIPSNPIQPWRDHPFDQPLQFLKSQLVRSRDCAGVERRSIMKAETLFAGPSEKQRAKFKVDAAVETEYMRWLYNEGKGSSLALCSEKYQQLKTKAQS